MAVLLVADKDVATRKRIADLLIDAGYDVMVTDSALKAIYGAVNKTAQVVLLGLELNEFNSVQLVPLLKKCNSNLMIILVADDAPLPLIRKVRQAGIFYHALRPSEPEDMEEIIQAVKCAVASLTRGKNVRESHGY